MSVCVCVCVFVCVCVCVCVCVFVCVCVCVLKEWFKILIQLVVIQLARKQNFPKN